MPYSFQELFDIHTDIINNLTIKIKENEKRIAEAKKKIEKLKWRLYDKT